MTHVRLLDAAGPGVVSETSLPRQPVSEPSSCSKSCTEKDVKEAFLHLMIHNSVLMSKFDYAENRTLAIKRYLVYLRDHRF